MGHGRVVFANNDQRQMKQEVYEGGTATLDCCSSMSKVSFRVLVLSVVHTRPFLASPESRPIQVGKKGVMGCRHRYPYRDCLVPR